MGVIKGDARSSDYSAYRDIWRYINRYLQGSMGLAGLHAIAFSTGFRM